MFAITVLVGSAGWSLLYKTKEPWQLAINILTDKASDELTLTDDFGQTAVLKTSDVHGFMSEDLEQSKMAHVERALHQMRMQADTQKRAESDPAMRMLRAQHPMLVPGGMIPPAPNGGRWPA